jgi:hypothetical protein
MSIPFEKDKDPDETKRMVGHLVKAASIPKTGRLERRGMGDPLCRGPEQINGRLLTHFR